MFITLRLPVRQPESFYTVNNSTMHKNATKLQKKSSTFAASKDIRYCITD